MYAIFTYVATFPYRITVKKSAISPEYHLPLDPIIAACMLHAIRMTLPALNFTRHWGTVVRAVKKLFIFISSSWDPPLPPSLIAPPLVFALLACRLFPFPLVLLGVADPLDIP